MSRAARLSVICAAAAVVLVTAAFALSNRAAEQDDAPLPVGTVADLVVVEKEARTMTLLSGGEELKTYRVALGPSPDGHKVREGDGRTPEGRYLIDFRKEDSAFHRALHISYPNADDIARASELGVDPGGDIMIHGFPTGVESLPLHPRRDWTLGCIAVTSDEIDEIWQVVPNGTPIEIRP